jgi:hypothetical protein
VKKLVNQEPRVLVKVTVIVKRKKMPEVKEKLVVIVKETPWIKENLMETIMAKMLRNAMQLHLANQKMMVKYKLRSEC